MFNTLIDVLVDGALEIVLGTVGVRDGSSTVRLCSSGIIGCGIYAISLILIETYPLVDLDYCVVRQCLGKHDWRSGDAHCKEQDHEW